MGWRFTGRGAVRRGGEAVTLLDAFLARLARLGALPDELEAVRAAWDDPVDDGWLMTKDELVALPDASLRAMLEANRAEFAAHTTVATDPEEAAAGFAALATDRTDDGRYKVRDVREWVGGDRIRARVALDVELAYDEPRATLVAFLTALAG